MSYMQFGFYLRRQSNGCFADTTCADVWSVAKECIPTTRHYCLKKVSPQDSKALYEGNHVCGLPYCAVCAMEFKNERTDRCPFHMTNNEIDNDEENFGLPIETIVAPAPGIVERVDGVNSVSNTLESLSSIASQMDKMAESENIIYPRPNNAHSLDNAGLTTDEANRIYVIEDMVFGVSEDAEFVSVERRCQLKGNIGSKKGCLVAHRKNETQYTYKCMLSSGCECKVHPECFVF